MDQPDTYAPEAAPAGRAASGAAADEAAAGRAGLPVLLLTMTVNMTGIGLLMPVLPKLIDQLAPDLSVAATTYGLIVAAYSLMQFVFGPLLGAISDRVGRRPVILYSMGGLGLHYLLMAVAPSLAWIAVARIVGGMMGASVGAATAYVADITPPEKRAGAFGLVGVAFGLGFILGPLLGGLLGEIGLRVPFYAAAGLCAVNLWLAWRYLPESLPADRRRPFRLREANPVGAFRMMGRYPLVVALLVVFAFTQLAERALESTWVLFTEFRFQWGPAEVGISLAVVGLLIAFTEGVLVRAVVPRVGERRMLVAGLVIGGLCMAVLAFATAVWVAYLAIGLYVVGWGIVGPVARAMASRTVRGDEQGTLQGAITSLTTATGIVGPPVAAGLFGFFVSDSAPFVFPGAAYVLGALLFGVSLWIAFRPAFRKAMAGEGAADQLPGR